MHKNYRIHGKVQGVFFRDSTRQKATDLGITGWVRNEPDGTVYLEAEGSENQLSELEDWLQHGSPQAEVDKIEKEEGEEKSFTSFEIK